jgi:hypothetical protein
VRYNGPSWVLVLRCLVRGKKAKNKQLSGLRGGYVHILSLERACLFLLVVIIQRVCLSHFAVPSTLLSSRLVRFGIAAVVFGYVVGSPATLVRSDVLGLLTS